MLVVSILGFFTLKYSEKNASNSANNNAIQQNEPVIQQNTPAVVKDKNLENITCDNFLSPTIAIHLEEFDKKRNALIKRIKRENGKYNELKKVLSINGQLPEFLKDVNKEDIEKLNNEIEWLNNEIKRLSEIKEKSTIERL